MCIICYKPENKKLAEETLREMLANNPDGAGFAYYDKKRKIIKLSKGYLDANSAVRAIMEIPTSAPAIIHCRIKTHGTHAVGQTHPFPIVADKKLLEKEDLEITNGYAVAHNGIFQGVSLGSDFSDTEAFIYKILAPLASSLGKGIRLTDPSLKDLIDRLVDNCRLAIMDGKDGSVELYGDNWVWDEGLAYSNTTYKPKPIYSYSYNNHKNENKRLCEITGKYECMRWDYKVNKYMPITKDVGIKSEWEYDRKVYLDSDGNIYNAWGYGAVPFESDMEYIAKGNISKYYCERNAQTIEVKRWSDGTLMNHKY